MNKFISFFTKEEPSVLQYGCLIEEENKVICFCCGGTFDIKEIDCIIEEIPWQYLHEVIEQYM